MRRVVAAAAASLVLHLAMAALMPSRLQPLEEAEVEITAMEVMWIEETEPSDNRRQGTGNGQRATGDGQTDRARRTRRGWSGSSENRTQGTGHRTQDTGHRKQNGSEGAVRLRLDPRGAAARIAEAPYDGPFEAPAGRSATSELRPVGEGRYVTELRGFTALTAPDGMVSFDDRHGGAAPPRS